MIQRVLTEVWVLPRNIAIAVMRVYRAVISPLYGQVCRYHPSCSRYSMEAYQRCGFIAGMGLTVWRLLRCNPWSAGGIDDVPDRLHSNLSINARGFVRLNDRKA